MITIIKNSWKIFFRNSEYMETILSPLLMLIVFSFLLSFNGVYSIAVSYTDNNENGLKIEQVIQDTDNLKFVETSNQDDAISQIALGTIDAVILVDDNNVSITSSSKNSELTAYLNSLIDVTINGIQSDSNVTFNDVEKKGLSISGSLGVVIFKVITGGALFGSILIMERKKNIKFRIQISGISYTKYLLGKSIVFIINTSVGIILYYLVALIFNFDFGMENTIYFLIFMLCMNIFATSVYAMLSVFCNDRGNLWSTAVFVLLPMTLMSGALVPFSLMPSLLQKIGNCFPQRWLCIAVEKVQQGCDISEAIVYILGILALSIIFYIIAIVRGKKIME